MAGKMGWVLAIALACAAAVSAAAQTPQAPIGQDVPKIETPGTGEPGAPMLGAPMIPTAFQPIQSTLYVKADYLLWWVQRGPLPEQPLVTTGPQTSVNAGIVGQPGTQTLFGKDSLNWAGSSGVRVTAGFNFNADRTWGLEATGFFLPRQTVNFSAASTAPGTPLITRPIFDNVNNVESTYDVSSTDPATNLPRVSGRVDIQATTELWGYEVNFVHHPLTANGSNVDLYFGFRSLGLDEKFLESSGLTQITQGVVTFLGPTGPGLPGVKVNVGDHVTTADYFATSNRFYGPQVGGGFNWQWGRLGASLTGKVAAGVNNETVTINGVTTLVQNGVETAQAVGGILAQKTNIGNYSKDVFCLVPEFDLGLAYDITPWLRARFGYNILYCSSVARPGSQIDRNIDITQVPSDQNFGKILINGVPTTFPATRPAFNFVNTDFWAQGLSFGMEIRY
jgi:hypothetical protein